MNVSHRAVRLTAQIALLLALLSTAAFLLLRTYLGDEERIYNEGAITEVVTGGPVTIGNVEWKLEALQPWTQLVDAEKKPISMDQPAGSVVVVARIAITPRDGLKMNSNGFSCEARLRDDRGNVWKGQSAYGFALPTYCGDEDHPFTRNKPGEVAQIFVIPQSAVAHISGIQVENLEERRRVLITR
ncbi:hypothetical protein GCM10009789_16950 [Kribbella sancticallisti]|uniref:Uncharacterized protein n=1 Tax=Kribbella sancticallisti TaxID=460087 RepID=A0ABP4NML9_9ACTN